MTTWFTRTCFLSLVLTVIHGTRKNSVANANHLPNAKIAYSGASCKGLQSVPVSIQPLTFVGPYDTCYVLSLQNVYHQSTSSGSWCIYDLASCCARRV